MRIRGIVVEVQGTGGGVVEPLAIAPGSAGFVSHERTVVGGDGKIERVGVGLKLSSVHGVRGEVGVGVDRGGVGQVCQGREPAVVHVGTSGTLVEEVS